MYGSKSKKIIDNRHNTLISYGIGKEYSKKQWQAFIRELIQLGYLKLEGDRYPTIKVTQKFRDTLSEQEKVLLTKPTENIPVMQKDIKGDSDCGLLEILRSFRKKLADDEGMPPYIIFHDSSLRAMATYSVKYKIKVDLIISKDYKSPPPDNTVPDFSEYDKDQGKCFEKMMKSYLLSTNLVKP